MSNRLTASALAALIILLSSSSVWAAGKPKKGEEAPPPPPPPDPAVVECKVPFKPATAINGVTATEEQITNLFGAVKRYQNQLAVYRSCLDAKIQAASTAGDDTQAVALTRSRDQSVDDETIIVTAYNGTLHAFCASHPDHGNVTCPK